ncbi:MAG: methyltransferase domain-containing protein [Candidatus Omnitrophota bacterium]|jgi:2-polyprenyl-3-methyl-5-hydroxy-6-metoxy-1,4-benzoquinol methylase
MKFDVMGNEDRKRAIYRKYINVFMENGPVLDAGCGSGIFLELLKESNREGIGVDINDEYVAVCVRKGLKVSKTELLEFLKTTDLNLSGVFAAHIIEHLSGEQAFELLKLFFMKLAPGGRVVIITPNTKDLGVITETFWLDLTHIRPYPMGLLEKLFTDIGFKIVAKGEDADVKPRVKRSFKSIIKHLRFGEFINRGDLFIIGEKPK